ncbi:hypothetical protein [Piscinibacter sp.]|uniref:hypothetical protein n=1 Tax=Piscinibacter sp. TaxID=1903157 RepID=UPI002CDDF862|nr:hypothetical protein [Albitalea sp.]HUG22528.1 hypothetical protein [Albitalea sp.]
MKSILAILALATASIGALASEASPSVEPMSTLDRAEVRADITRPDSGVMHIGDATVFAAPSGQAASRADVRAEALAQVRHGAVISYGEVTEFTLM